MKRTRMWLAATAAAAAIAVLPMSAAAQESSNGAGDQMVIIGWQDDDGGPIYARASDVPAIIQAQRQSQIASQPALVAADLNDCTQ